MVKITYLIKKSDLIVRKTKIGILTGIILISTLFLFIQPIKGETEIIGILPSDDKQIGCL